LRCGARRRRGDVRDPLLLLVDSSTTTTDPTVSHDTREGNLQAPTAIHRLARAEFHDERALYKEMERIFDICPRMPRWRQPVQLVPDAVRSGRPPARRWKWTA